MSPTRTVNCIISSCVLKLTSAKFVKKIQKKKQSVLQKVMVGKLSTACDEIVTVDKFWQIS